MLPSLVLNLPELPRFILIADADQPTNGCCTGITKPSKSHGSIPEKEVRAGWSSGDVIPPQCGSQKEPCPAAILQRELSDRCTKSEWEHGNGSVCLQPGFL